MKGSPTSTRTTHRVSNTRPMLVRIFAKGFTGGRASYIVRTEM